MALLNKIKGSVSFALTTSVTLVMILCMSALVYVQSSNYKSSMYDAFEKSNVVKTQLLSTQLIGAVKWKKEDQAKGVYSNMLLDPSTNLADVYTESYDGKFKTFNTLTKTTFENFDISGFLEANKEARASGETHSIDTPNHHVIYTPIIDPKKGKQLGGIWAFWSKESIQGLVKESSRTSTTIATSIVLVLIVMIIILLRSTIISPLNQHITIMRALASGDNNIEIRHLKKENEIGTIARSIEVFKQNSIEKEKSEEQRRQLEQQSEEDRQKLLNDMAEKFEEQVSGIVQTLSVSVDDMSATSKQLSAIANKTEQQSAEAATFSDQTSQNVQTVASASEELDSSVQEIVSQISRATTMTNDADNKAKNTSTIVLRLQESTTKIGDVVKLIQDIAEQTNLLALNATIESARAGEAGKGFAVVANEVKSLATETSKATEDIAEQIHEIQDISNQSSVAINDIANSITHISESMTAVSSAVEEQGSATQEISRSSQEAANGTSIVSSNVSSVNEATKETLSIAKNSSDVSERLLQQSNILKSSITEFISQLRQS